LFHYLLKLDFNGLLYGFFLSLDFLSRLGNEISSLRCARAILADQLVGGLARFSDFEHGMLVVDALCLTVLAKVEIVAHRAHVTDANNWGHSTSITNNAGVHLLCLFGAFLLKVVIEESAELASAILSDLFAHEFAHLFEALCAENARAVAFAARKTFLVDFGATAFKAINLFFHGFLRRIFAVGY